MVGLSGAAGALDMKGGVAMLVHAFLRRKLDLEHDVKDGARTRRRAGSSARGSWAVEEQPELFAGVTHALGEFGACSLSFGATAAST